jgi:hypothetical protein
VLLSLKKLDHNHPGEIRTEFTRAAIGVDRRMTNSESEAFMFFKQLFDPTSSTYTYLIADDETHEAVLIDPVIE